MIVTIKFQNKESLCGTINEIKSLTKEQLHLGSTQNFSIDDENYVSLWCQNPEINLYSIAGYYQGNYFWIQWGNLTTTRKVYKKIQTIIKRQKKTVKDIEKLDERYHFPEKI